MSSTDPGNSTASWLSITPAVTDNVDDSPDVSCSHSSRDIFQLGYTLVTCSATDDSGNYADCSFNVTVKGISKYFYFCRLHMTRLIYTVYRWKRVLEYRLDNYKR